MKLQTSKLWKYAWTVVLQYRLYPWISARTIRMHLQKLRGVGDFTGVQMATRCMTKEQWSHNASVKKETCVRLIFHDAKFDDHLEQFQE